MRLIAAGELHNLPIHSEDENEDEDEDEDEFKYNMSEDSDTDLDDQSGDFRNESLLSNTKCGSRRRQVHTTEAEDLLETVRDTIESLFRLSKLIHVYKPRDRFTEALRCSKLFDESLDVAQVGRIFPKLARAPNEWLKLRLGKATTQRRRYIQYAREHIQRLNRRTEMIKSASENTQKPAPFTIHAELPARSEATSPGISENRSTIAPTSNATSDLTIFTVPGVELKDPQSQTSFALSFVDRGSDDYSRFPSLEEISNGNSSFQCPFCWKTQSYPNELAWRKHLFTDLRPYVCTFEECDLRLFSNRQDLFQHEMSYHRRDWPCPFRHQEGHQSPDDLRQHLRQHHTQRVNES